MNTAEMMAVAVLKGDMVAARALADLLFEQVNAGAREIPPIKHLKVGEGRVSAIVYMNSDGATSTATLQVMSEAVSSWLRHGGPLMTVGVERIELYELPPHEQATPEQTQAAFAMGQQSMALHQQISAEREACAKIVEQVGEATDFGTPLDACYDAARQIRAREQQSGEAVAQDIVAMIDQLTIRSQP